MYCKLPLLPSQLLQCSKLFDIIYIYICLVMKLRYLTVYRMLSDPFFEVSSKPKVIKDERIIPEGGRTAEVKDTNEGCGRVVCSTPGYLRHQRT